MISLININRTFCSSQSLNSFYDIVIVGGGLVGSALACSMGSSPYLKSKRVLLLESKKQTEKINREGLNYSNRVSAINPSSINLFKKIGVWNYIKESRVRKISALYVVDGCTNAKIFFDQVETDSPMAFIAENDVIVNALHRKISEEFQNVTLLHDFPYNQICIPEDLSTNVVLKMGNGEQIVTSLLVAADGASSKIREISGFVHSADDYNQMAIVGTLVVSTDDEENTIAWQKFLPTGPIAILPLTKGLSSLVWTTTKAEATSLLQLTPENFVDQLNNALLSNSLDKNSPTVKAFDCLNGIVNCLPFRSSSPNYTLPHVIKLNTDDRAAFPLSLVLANEFVRPRIALIGDAAHRVHPLAGQGVNLGWSDVNFLTNALENAIKEGADLGALTYLKQFDSDSQRKNVPIAVAIDNLNRLFSTDFPFNVLLRSTGFSILDRLLPAKDLIVWMAS